MTTIAALRILTRAVDIYGNVPERDRQMSRSVWLREVLPAMEVARAVCELADAAEPKCGTCGHWIRYHCDGQGECMDGVCDCPRASPEAA